MSRPLKVGVVGSTSAVARLAVIPALSRSAVCELAATASLSDSAATYDSYEALLGDDDVEAVYIPLPNSLHREWVEKAAAAGKHVLCEKPLAPSATDGLAMKDACEATGVVLMEAYMTPFHPRDAELRRLLATGALGELVAATARFTGVLDRPDDHRWHPEMGGGSLLDLGIYCVTPLLAAAGVEAGDAGAVKDVSGAARRNEWGVDSSFGGWLDFDEGRAASFHCSFEAPERQLVSVVGTEASVSVERAFTPGPEDTEIRLEHRDGSVEKVTAAGADPYLEMVEHFAAVVAGEIEPARSLEESIGLQRLLDRLAWSAEPAAT